MPIAHIPGTAIRAGIQVREAGMASIVMETGFPVPAATLWTLVGWAGMLGDWYPGLSRMDVQGADKGAIRRLVMLDGTSMVERLEHLSRIETAYTYSILSSPLPVADYLAQIRIKDRGGDTSTLIWSGNFEPDGVPEDRAIAAVRAVYQAGFINLNHILMT